MTKVTRQQQQLLPQEVADVVGASLCPSVCQVFSAHQPQSQFDHMLLILHCLMVEAGFSAAAEAEAEESRPDFALPSSVSEQLRRRPQLAASVSIVYALRARAGDCRRAPGRALLKVVDTGRLAACHCGVAASPVEPPVACASGHFNVERHVQERGGDSGTGRVRLSGLRELAVLFKDCVAQPAKVALHAACGLPPPQSSLPGLPDELLLRVARACDFASVCRLSQASRRLRDLCADNSIWRQQLRRQFGANGCFRWAGVGADLRDAFRAAQSERALLTRAIARRGSRELALLPGGSASDIFLFRET